MLCIECTRLSMVYEVGSHICFQTCFVFHFSDSASNVPSDIDLNRPSALKVSNPFVVLNEGIAETLGKPMFERNIAPKR